MDQSPFMSEVQQITDKGTSLTTHNFVAQLHNGTEWITCYNVLGVQHVRDYQGSFGEMVYVTVQIALGDLFLQVLPNKRTLKLTLQDSSRVKGGNISTTVREYNAILLNQDDPTVTLPRDVYLKREYLNQQGFINVEFQLFDEATYRVRMESVGGIYRNTTPINVLQSLLGQTTELKGNDNRKLVNGVEVYPGANQTPRKQIVIPHGLRVVDLAHYLQAKEGGIYSTGIGCYLEDGTWYVFPPYNVTMANAYQRTATILLMTGKRFQTETTYRKEGDNLTVLANGNNITADISQVEQLNSATGVRFQNANQLIENGSKVKANKVVLSRNSNLSEFTTNQLNDNLANAQFAEERVTSNPFKHYSALARHNCRYVDIEWAHGDIEELHPGMPVNVVTIEGDNTKTYQGVLVNCSQTLTPVQEGAVKDTFAGVIRMGINVELNPIG